MNESAFFRYAGKGLVQEREMAVYQVRLVNPAIALDRTLAVPDDQYILDIAEDAGIRLPAGCKLGECSGCVAKLLEGEVEQTEQKFLRSPELAAGYTVTCVAYPRSNCTLLTHQEQVLYGTSLYYAPKADSAPQADAPSDHSHKPELL